MSDYLLSGSAVGLTFVLLIIAMGLFVWLTLRSKGIRSFQFQLSLFIVIWILGEIAGLLQGVGAVNLIASVETGLYIHVTAMALFAVMLWTRFYLARKAGKTLADSIQEG